MLSGLLERKQERKSYAFSTLKSDEKIYRKEAVSKKTKMNRASDLVSARPLVAVDVQL